MKNPVTFRRVLDLGIKGSITSNPDGVVLPDKIELLQTGAWDTPYHGTFEITDRHLDEYVFNFDQGTRRGVPIDLEHNTIGGAAGWIEKLYTAPASSNPEKKALWGSVTWTPKGEDALGNREYKFFSPEFADKNYQDPETGEFFNNVLIGGGLTNRPLFKNLMALVANDSNGDKSTKDLTQQHKNNIIYLSEENNQVNLEDILAKAPADLTDEEKQFVVDNQADLTDEQKTTFADVLTPPAGDEGSGDEGDEGDEGEGDEGAGEGEGTQGSEKGKKGQVTISASELKKLRADAAKGVSANDRLEKKEVAEHIATLTFNDKGGKIPTTASEVAQALYLSLNTAQRKQFNELMSKIPNRRLMDELGKDQGAEGSALEEVRQKANELVEKEKAAGKDITYGMAVKKVMASDKALASRYNDEKESK